MDKEKFIEVACNWLDEHIDQELEVYDVGRGGWHNMSYEEWKGEFKKYLEENL